MQSFAKITFLFFLFGPCLLGATPETRHIHVLKMLDDNSTNYIVSEGARSIDYGIDRKVEQIQQQLGITTVYEYRITGTDFSRGKLQEILEYELSYQERDIIILVYAGHGYREQGSQSRFPKLYFNNYAEGLEFGDLRQQLLEKNPSLLINLVVACNVTQYDLSAPPPLPSDANPPPVARLAPRAGQPKGGTNRWRHLFADNPGYTKVVDLLSADRENFTFIGRDGGVFFNEVLYAFQEVFNGGNFRSWNELCAYIGRGTVARSQERQLTQNPYVNFEIYFATAVEVRETYLTRSECRQMARTLRRQQRGELKNLRRRHREEIRGLSRLGDFRARKRLVSARHKQEKAELRLTHLQNYHRSLTGCR